MTALPPLGIVGATLLPAHAGHATPPPPLDRVAIATFAGFFAALVTDVPMDRLDEGRTPTAVAASVLYAKPSADLRESEARSVHYTAGVLAGALFALLAAAAETVAPPVAVLPGGLPLLSHLLAGAAVLAFLYAFFGHVVLPRFGREKAGVADRVRRHWAVSATVYVLALLAGVPAAAVLLY